MILSEPTSISTTSSPDARAMASMIISTMARVMRRTFSIRRGIVALRIRLISYTQRYLPSVQSVTLSPA